MFTRLLQACDLAAVRRLCLANILVMCIPEWLRFFLVCCITVLGIFSHWADITTLFSWFISSLGHTVKPIFQSLFTTLQQRRVSSFCVLTNAQRVSNNHQLTLDLWLLTYRLPARMWCLKHSLVENDFCRQNKQPEARNVNRYCSWTCQHKKYGFTTLDCIMLFISSRYSVDLIE